MTTDELREEVEAISQVNKQGSGLHMTEEAVYAVIALVQRTQREAAESVCAAVEKVMHCGWCRASWDDKLCIGSSDEDEPNKECDCHAFIKAARLAANSYSPSTPVADSGIED